MKKYRSWGITVLDGLYNAMDWECECGWKIWGPASQIARHVIGFNHEVVKIGRGGAIVFQCPKCQSIFWIHMSAENLEFYQEHCPDWPKET